jgi:hypothetical protein
MLESLGVRPDIAGTAQGDLATICAALFGFFLLGFAATRVVKYISKTRHGITPFNNRKAWKERRP